MGEGCGQVLVVQLVPHVDQERAAGGHGLDGTEGFSHGHVRGVGGRVPEGVDDQSVQAAQGADRLFGHALAVGEVGEAVHQLADQAILLGIQLDSQKNNAYQRGQEAVISTTDSRVKIMAVPTNEEIVVAREVEKLLESKP